MTRDRLTVGDIAASEGPNNDNVPDIAGKGRG